MNIDYEELQEVGFYEYVSRHYWEMSKDQLSQFVKEIAYAAEYHCRLENYAQEAAEKAYKDIEAAAIDELKDLGV